MMDFKMNAGGWVHPAHWDEPSQNSVIYPQVLLDTSEKAHRAQI